MGRLTVKDVARPVLRGAERAAGARLRGLIASTDNDPGRESALLGVIRARRCEGYVIASASRPDEAVATLVAEGVPVVLVNRLADVVAPSVTSDDAGVTGLFQRLGDKWSLLTLTLLGGRPHRFTELNRRIEGISQRMLTRL